MTGNISERGKRKMVCEKCKRKIPDNVKFCPYCGEPVNCGGVPVKKKESNKRKVVLGVVCVLIIAVGVVSLFEKISGKDKNEVDPGEKSEIAKTTEIETAEVNNSDEELDDGLESEAAESNDEKKYYNEDGEEIEYVCIKKKEAYGEDTKRDIEYEYEFNDSGRIVKELHYQSQGELMGWYEYEYDDMGNCVRRTVYDSSGSIYEFSTYEYDGVGGLLKLETFLGDKLIASVKCQCDDKGNQLKQFRYDFDGILSSWSENIFEDESNRVRCHLDYNPDDTFIGKTEFEYDNDENLLGYKRYDAEGKLDGWTEYAYDEAGNLLKRVFYNADGTISSWEENEYQQIVEYLADNR